MGSYSFTCHPRMPLLPSCKASPPFGWYSLRLTTKCLTPRGDFAVLFRSFSSRRWICLLRLTSGFHLPMFEFRVFLLLVIFDQGSQYSWKKLDVVTSSVSKSYSIQSYKQPSQQDALAGRCNTLDRWVVSLGCTKMWIILCMKKIMYVKH